LAADEIFAPWIGNWPILQMSFGANFGSTDALIAAAVQATTRLQNAREGCRHDRLVFSHSVVPGKGASWDALPPLI